MRYLMHVPENNSWVLVDMHITPKTIIIRPLEEKPFYTNGCIDELWDKGKIIIRNYPPESHKLCIHYIESWSDGTYTFYPQRAGQPYYLEKLKEK